MFGLCTCVFVSLTRRTAEAKPISQTDNTETNHYINGFELLAHEYAEQHKLNVMCIKES